MNLEFLNNIHSHSSKKDVISSVIIPFLNSIGYEFFDWEEKPSFFSSKPDFSIPSSDPKHPFLVIDVKRAQAKITDSNDGSIIKHLQKSKATLGLLTNGHTFQLFFRNGEIISKIIDYNQQSLCTFFDLIRALIGKHALFQINQEIEAGREVNYSQMFKQVWEKYSPLSENNNQPELEVFEREHLTPIQHELQSKKSKEPAKIITIFNNKGGVGKTTLTINLGAALNHQGNKVLLVDIDAQANLTTGLGIDPYEDLELNNMRDISDLLVDPSVHPNDNLVITKSWANTTLNIIPSHIRLAEERDSLIVKQLNYDSLLKRKLDKCLDDYDYILIDPPPSFGVANRMALMACDALLVPTQFAPYSIRALEYVIQRVIAVQEAKGTPLHILGMAISMFFTNAHRVTYDSLKQINTLIEELKIDCGDSLPIGNIGLLPENTWVPHYSIVASSTSDEYARPICELDHENAQEAFSSFMHMAAYIEKYFAQAKQKGAIPLLK